MRWTLVLHVFRGGPWHFLRDFCRIMSDKWIACLSISISGQLSFIYIFEVQKCVVYNFEVQKCVIYIFEVQKCKIINVFDEKK